MNDLLTKIYMDELIARDESVKRGLKSWILGAIIPMPVIALVADEPIITLLYVVIVHCILISGYLIYQLCKPGI